MELTTKTFEERALRIDAEMLYAREHGLQNIEGEPEIEFDFSTENDLTDETETKTEE